MAPRNAALELADALATDDCRWFTFEDACARLGKPPSATGNLLKSMLDAGLVDRVRRGHYALRQLGMLGTPSWAEDIALTVGTAFAGIPHRIAYRSALDENGLLVHPLREIQVASVRRIRPKALSGWPLTVIKEAPEVIGLGAVACGGSCVSDVERSLLEAARRPGLAGGLAVLAVAITMAGNRVDAAKLVRYAELLGWSNALRRLGSIADALPDPYLANSLPPPKRPWRYIGMDPARPETAWQDPRWGVLWPQPVSEIRAEAGH